MLSTEEEGASDFSIEGSSLNDTLGDCCSSEKGVSPDVEILQCNPRMGEGARGWGTSGMEAEDPLLATDGLLVIESDAVVKAEASSWALRRASTLLITFSVRGAIKDYIPSNFYIEERANPLSAVALEEENSHPSLVIFPDEETVPLAVEEAEM